MSIKHMTAALALAFASQQAEAQEACSSQWLDTREVAKSIFAVPSSQWNMAFLGSIGRENVDDLVKNLQGSVHNKLVRDSDRIFSTVERNLTNERGTDWQKIEDGAHFIFGDVLAKVRDGEIDLPTARAEATVAIGAYISSNTDALMQNPLTGSACPIKLAP